VRGNRQVSIALLDINDSNLQLWFGGDRVQSPGYALLEGREYHFGGPARAAARLRPRDINTRYWWQLSTEPLQPALGPARHTADLVHAHLLDLHRQAGEPAEVVLAVSGSMQREQLALLLGIVQQCPFDAVGMVNRSVALGSLYPAAGRLFHLEIQLHQALLSELSAREGRVELRRSVPLPGCGMLQLQERLVEIIAAAFIRQTRFDPRRKATTEQQLYDALPAALRALWREAETNLEVNGYRARVNRTELLGAGQRLFTSVPEAIGGTQPEDRIITDPIAGLLPGLLERLPGPEVLPPEALYMALNQHRDRLVQRGEALAFITSLPCLEEPAIRRPEHSEPAPVTESVPAPTHWLQGNRALPLVPGGTEIGPDCLLFRGDRGWQLRGDSGSVRVNGAQWRHERPLRAGDSITTDSGAQLLLIEVVPDGD
jgi:hypothetical protein